MFSNKSTSKQGTTVVNNEFFSKQKDNDEDSDDSVSVVIELESDSSTFDIDEDYDAHSINSLSYSEKNGETINMPENSGGELPLEGSTAISEDIDKESIKPLSGAGFVSETISTDHLSHPSSVPFHSNSSKRRRISRVEDSPSSSGSCRSDHMYPQELPEVEGGSSPHLVPSVMSPLPALPQPRSVAGIMDGQIMTSTHGSYDSVMNLPGTLMDDSQPLAKGDVLANKYDDMHYKVNRSTDAQKVLQTVETQNFRDNRRQIDFVLVYKECDDSEDNKKRSIFEQHLEEEGLELELEDKSQSQDGATFFLKIHAPFELLVRYAEIMNLKKPIRSFVIVRGGEIWKDDTPTKPTSFFSWLGIGDPFQYDEQLIPPEPSYFTTGFSKAKQDQFIIKDRESFFTPAQRSLIVWEILLRVRYSNQELAQVDKFQRRSVGLSRLLAKDIYSAAFPLHDGRYDRDGPANQMCDRRKLFKEWASPKKFYKKQPLHLVRRYFGDKMALYFAWLGFYTEMLIPAAIIGIITFVSGAFFVISDYNKPSIDICEGEAGNITMCPFCDQLCNFQQLHESCFTSKIAFLFDNPATVFFSIAMSFWATTFLELWKRKQAVLQWQWDLEDFEEEEEPRPEFEEKVKTTRINPVTRKPEPYLPFVSKLGRCLAVNSVVALMLSAVMAAVFSVVVYRMAVSIVMYRNESDFIKRNVKLITSVSAATINLIVIIIGNLIYERVAEWLTNLEAPRTETEYEDSFTLKMFFFQSINFYTSLVYIAFFKGRFMYHPGDQDSRKNMFTKLRYDQCDPAGCLFELCVQLAIIMVGKQILNNIVEILVPMLRVWWNKRSGHDNEESQVYTRWEQDYDLAPYTRLSLFNEYLEMAIQYGFVTLFVAAFPLAPFFALLNNVIEIRLDAYKYLTQCRRPRAERAQDIGVWYLILKAITYISVLTNAAVISYTSDFIPRLVYMYGYSKTGSLTGYVENTLSVFNVSEYDGVTSGPDITTHPREKWPSVCMYKAYRNPPEDEKRYEFTLKFWHVFTARLAFILVFEHIVFVLTGIVSMAIPDIPVEVKNQMKREKKVEKETLFETEMKKIRQERIKKGIPIKTHSVDDQSGQYDIGEGSRSRYGSRSSTAGLSKTTSSL